jgi:hypothetical protein
MSHANNTDFSQREVTLIAAVESKLPDFAKKRNTVSLAWL